MRSSSLSFRGLVWERPLFEIPTFGLSWGHLIGLWVYDAATASEFGPLLPFLGGELEKRYKAHASEAQAIILHLLAGCAGDDREVFLVRPSSAPPKLGRLSCEGSDPRLVSCRLGVLARRR